MKNFTKRRVTYYGNPTVEISIGVYNADGLVPDELKRLGDALADDAMRSINASPFVKAPISRINVKRNAK